MITKEPNVGTMVTLTLPNGKKQLAMFSIIRGEKGFITNSGFVKLTPDLKW